MSLEKEFSLIENGFKEEEKRALSDYRSNDKEFVKKLAFLAYNSNTYQVRMYGVFLFGYLSEQNDILTFMISFLFFLHMLSEILNYRKIYGY